MKKGFVALAALFLLARPLVAVSATAGDLEGTWRLDIDASESALLAAPPYKLVGQFAMVTSLWCCILLTFDGRFVNMGLYGGGGNPGRYELASATNGELSYAFKNVESQPAWVAQKQSELVVTVLDGDRLSIRFPNDRDSSHYLPQLRWRRAGFDASRAPPNDVLPMINGWFAALQRIQKVLDGNPPISKGARK